MLHAISLHGVFELVARDDMVDFDLAWVERDATYRACGAFEEDDFFGRRFQLGEG